MMLPGLRYFLSLLSFLLLLASSLAVAAPDLPVSLVLVGEIRPGAGPLSTSAREGDRVLAFGVQDMQLAGTGSVFAAGQYLAVLSRTASFNGAQVVLELQQGRRRYALLKPDGTPAAFRFQGHTLPDKVPFPLLVGQKTAELSEAEAATPQAQRLSLRADLPCTAEADVNEDGRCDGADLEILSRYAGGVSRTVGRP